MFTRRQFIYGAGAAGLGLAGIGLAHKFGLCPGSCKRGEIIADGDTIRLTSRLTDYTLNKEITTGLVSLVDGGPPPVIRLKQGKEVTILFTNGLSQHSTLHWHGLRINNQEDGVPYLTQFPMAKGETYAYTFTPPDAGTYWYHSHCHALDQMSKGLTGILIVDEKEEMGFDEDIALNLKSFRLDYEDQLLPAFTPRGAAKSGTNGNIITTNWDQEYRRDVQPGALVRLRIVATDTTRIYKLIFPHIPGKIIALDGHPVEERISWPTEKYPLMLAPGQRIDVAFLMPKAGERVTFTQKIGARKIPIAKFNAAGVNLNRKMADIKPLPRNPIIAPDLDQADAFEIVFDKSQQKRYPDNGLCGSYPYTFWTVNGTAWPGDAVEEAPPVVTLSHGKSYILRLRNNTPYKQPIHLHGLVFKPINSNKRKIPKNYTDTILLLKNETVDIALRADNKGDWAFHSHILEHQKTGLSGYIRVV